MKIHNVVVGDVLWCWYDDGWNGDIQYFKVIKITPKTILVESEHHGRGRKKIYDDGFINFDGKVSPTSWNPWNEKGE